MHNYDINITQELNNKLIQYEQHGQTANGNCTEHELKGIIAVADTVKDTAKQAINHLQNMNIK